MKDKLIVFKIKHIKLEKTYNSENDKHIYYELITLKIKLKINFFV